MTSITRNFPWFIRDPAITLIGKKCYASLIENLDFSNTECLKFAISKALGVAIVVGGSIVKVPQVFIIINARSARGLSLPAYVLETLAYAITLAYAYRNALPFSTYGENFFLTLQNTLITLLIVFYPSSPSPLSAGAVRHGGKLTPTNTLGALLTLLATLAASYALLHVPAPALSFLQLLTLPLSLFSKLPQIIQNHNARSTGALSLFAVLSQILGCAARMFTTATEVSGGSGGKSAEAGRLLWWGFALAFGLNCVLGWQMYVYWGREEEVGARAGRGEMDMEKVQMAMPVQVGEKERAWARSGEVEVVIPPATPATPSGRKWARKVD